jgi:LPXTG-motif cell wall-anchored protein
MSRRHAMRFAATSCTAASLILVGLLGSGTPAAAAALAPVAAAAPAPTPPPLTLTSDAGPRPVLLVPGQSTPWLVDVVADVGELDSLLGQLSATGPLARSDAITAEVESCVRPWSGGTCSSGARTVLPPTALSALPTARAALEASAKPTPGTVHLQIRLALASDASIDTASNTVTAVLRVDASGTITEAGGPATLPDTGTRIGDYGALAAGAVLGGILLARAGAGLRRRRRA